MKKYRRIQVMLMLIVIFFHSFVLIPRAHATAFEGTLARVIFRSVAPSVITAMGSGMALVIGVPVAAGIGYLVYKSGAITALKNWWNSTQGAYNPNPDGSSWEVVPGQSYHIHVYYTSGSWGWATKTGTTCSNWNPATRACSGANLNSAWPYASAQAAWTAGVGTAHQNNPPPIVPTDYYTALQSSQPDFNSAAAVYGSPGVAASLANSAVASSVVTMTDAEADNFIAGLGGATAAAITDTGSQAGNPSITDNAVTAGDSAQVGLLQQILNFVSNLVGIKTGVDAVKTSVDNAVIAINQEKAVMDNVGTNINAMRGTMDNVGIAVNNNTVKMDNVVQGIEHIGSTTATANSISSRISAVKELAATKFPFSLVGGISVSAPSGGTYSFPALTLAPGISIDIDPMAGPFHDFIVWIRQLLVYFMWAGLGAAMVKKVMEM